MLRQFIMSVVACSSRSIGATIVLAYHPYSLPVLAWVRFSGSGLDSTLPLVLLLFVVAAIGLALSQLLARSAWH